MEFEFFKYEGTGNDFVIIDDREERFPLEDFMAIRRICDRHFGIGADGFIALRNAPETDFTMEYFNSDGKRSSMCGNGGRCIAAFARSLGICKNGIFSAIDGEHPYEFSGELIRLKMNDVLEVEERNGVFVLDTGSPHYVRFREDIYQIPLIEEAQAIRFSPRFTEEGINVNFAEFMEDGTLSMRTYERGVENETLSCGTGTVAVAVTAFLRDPACESPVTINTPGGKLQVYFESGEGVFRNVWLVGPARRTFKGIIDWEIYSG